jgi:aldehyde dehydrogenase (NAD+)
MIDSMVGELVGIDAIIKNQQVFFNSNTTKQIQYRVQMLQKLREVLKANEDEMYSAIYEDFGKSQFETYASELSLIYHELKNLEKNVPKWGKPQRVKTSLANMPGKSYIIPEPLGVTLVIGAWNYPYQLSLVPAITSLAAGNTVILKPSELPSRTSQIMAKLINRNFPKEYFHVIEGGVKETTELLNHRFDKIFFTGSTPVGKIVYQAAAKHLTPVTLELGGKSPTFVLADANLETSAKRIAWAKYLNAGQTCVAPDYILVEKSVEKPFLEALRKEINKKYQMNGELSENYLQIINEKNFHRLTQLVDKEKVFLGGEFHVDKRMICPTVMQDVHFEDEIMKDEIFGPILPVIAFENLDEVVRKVKERPKPLSCYIYSKNKQTVNKLLCELSFGGGAVNDSIMHLTNSHLPFGGVGHSGMGSYHGKAGFDDFTHYKSILQKPFRLEPKVKYAPYSMRKLKLIRWLME